MLVGFDARWYNRSGVGTYVLNLLRELGSINGNHRIVVYEDPNNPVPISSSRIIKSDLRAAKYSVAGQVELACRCRQDRLDLFHSPFYMVPLFANCPVVVTVHDLIPFLFPIYNYLHLQLVKAGYRIAVRKASRVIAVSQTTGRDLCDILSVPEERISVVYNGYSKQQYHRTKEECEDLRLREKYGVRKPYVLTLSANNWRTKNLETALAAIEAAAVSTRISFQTVVAGPETGLQASGMAGRIRNLVATGFVSAEDLPALYRNATAFVTVSHYEGFGLPLLEAMACGCPCVTSSGGSLGEVAAGAAAVFSPDDVGGMSRCLVSLLEDPIYRGELSTRGIARAACFSYKKAAVETLRVYTQSARGR